MRRFILSAVLAVGIGAAAAPAAEASWLSQAIRGFVGANTGGPGCVYGQPVYGAYPGYGDAGGYGYQALPYAGVPYGYQSNFYAPSYGYPPNCGPVPVSHGKWYKHGHHHHHHYPW